MKSFLLFISLLMCCASWASVKPSTEITKITKTRDFTVIADKNTDNGSQTHRFNIKIEAEYNSKNGGILFIKILNTENKKLTDSLNYPLDFYYYQIAIQGLFDSLHSDFIISYQSDLEIFNWLNSITLEPPTAPLAGTLHLSSFAYVYDKFNERTVQLDFNRDVKTIYQKQNQVKRYVMEINKLLEQGKKSALNGDDSNKLNEQYTKLDKILSDLNQQKIFKIDEVNIQFEGGFIERIQVKVNMGEYFEIFENSYPIGFSSIPNFEDVSKIKLYARGNKNGDGQFVLLSNVIQVYENELQLKTKDYSPADTVIKVNPISDPLVRLYKQQSRYIIDGKAFTDVNGFSEKSPNGLVQIELSRRFLLNTKRIQFQRQINFGFFTYLDVLVNYSKIENKLKGLPLQNERIIENQTVVSPSYATNLDFIRYENLSFRVDNNIAIWDVPHYKLTYYLDFGLRYGHTPVTDSSFVINGGNILGTPIDFSAHSFMIYPRMMVEVFAERRYGLKFSYQFNMNRILSNNNFKQVLSYSGKGNDLENLNINPAARFSHTVEAFAYFDANPRDRTGKLFALARFHFQHRDINTFFPQILIGYAFNIYN